MKKKIIGIAVFLFAALFMFTFANPASETEEKMDNNITTNDKKNVEENKNKEIKTEEKVENQTVNNNLRRVNVSNKVNTISNVKKEENSNVLEPFAPIGIDLDTVKKNAKKELENYLDKENYRENEQKEIDKIIDDAKEKIDNATTIEEINKIKEDTKQELDKVKTDKELTQEELEKAKKEAIANLKKYRDDNLSGNYFDEGTKVLAEATTKINSATTKENVTKLYNDYLKQLKELKEMQDYQKSSKFNITFGQYETNGACVKKIAGVCVKHEKVMKPNASISKKNNTKVALIFPQIHNVTIKYDGKVVEMPLYSNIKHTDISNVKYITLEYMILGDKIFCGSYVETYEIKFDVNGNRYVQLISSVKK